MKQNKVNHGWIRFIKFSGEYIDAPFPRGQDGEARKMAFDNAYRWTYSAISGGDKIDYDYYCLYSLNGDGSFNNNEKPVMLIYLPATKEIVENYEKNLDEDMVSPIKEIYGEPHYPSACYVNPDTNKIEVDEKTDKYLKELGYKSIYDLLTYERLFP